MNEMVQPAALTAGGTRFRWPAERVFYLVLSVAITVAMVIGFARTFFFRAWFPEWASAHGPAEPIFYIHGVAFADRRRAADRLHRRADAAAPVPRGAPRRPRALRGLRHPRDRESPAVPGAQAVDDARVLVLIEASIGRWPFAFMQWTSPVPGFSMLLLVADVFLVPMVVWDLVSRGRIHPVTLWGGVALVAAQPLRILLSGTSAWLAFAGWAVGLVR